MPRFSQNAVAALAAVVLSLGSLGAIVTVPSAQAAVLPTLGATEIA